MSHAASFACPFFVTKIFAWLDISINDSFAVRRTQSFRYFNRQIHQPFELHCLSIDQMLQRCAVQKLHCNERSAVFFADIMNGADVWMVQRRGCLRLSLKPRQRLRIFRNLIGKKLQPYITVRSRVFGFIDHSQAVRDGLPDKLVGAGHLWPS